MLTAADMARAFEARFGGEPRVFRAPGRVNLIGEHTDYNGGLVMPAAIELAVWAAVSPREDRRLIVHSKNYAETRELDLNDASQCARGHWSDYVLGVALTLERAGIRLRGANLLIRSEVPIGAGLSSSAALEAASALALLPEPVEGVRLAKLCQQAENEFAGVQCGIMDQFIAIHAREGNALMLDCRSLQYRLAPIPPGVKLAIANTMIRRDLAAGEYNRRRAECAEAAAFFDKKSLREVNGDELEAAEGRLADKIFRRARHVVTEDARVMEAETALDAGDLRKFGELMAESHRSLRDDYEVSCAELDAMVEIAQSLPGVYGSRMTGAGFGGCTINLVAEEQAGVFREELIARYREKTGIAAQVYVSGAAEGAGPVEIVNL